MRKFFTLLFLLGLSILTIAANSFAQISVDNVIVHIGVGERPVHNVIVSNNSSETAYVVTEVKAIPDPANDKSEAVISSDLLASPKAFSIEPNGQRTVRLLLKTPPGEKEKVFRVGFIPQDRGFGEEVEKNVGGRKAVIRVLTGMGILVFTDPLKPVADLQWERNGDKITFKNNGSVHVYLGDGKTCTPANVCTNSPSKRIYAGSSFQITTPPENTVSYLQQITALGENQKLTISPKG